MLECLIKPGMKVLLTAIGGGGDIVSAAVLSRSLSRLGINVVMASVAWERYINDPMPGPLRLEEIVNPIERGKEYVLISGRSYAIRGGRTVIFQAVNVARTLNERIYIVDLHGGVEGYVRALQEIASKEGVDTIIGVDVGGDSLAIGCEEGLWSPLADWMGLSALSRINGKLAIHSPGSDGELDQNYILERVDQIARRGGLLGIKVLCESDAKLLEELLKSARSEASLIPLLAHKGVRGEIALRRGTRRVKVSFLSTITFLLDARIVAEGTEPVRALSNTKSIQEARDTLNSFGIYTELDFEEDLVRLGISPDELSADVIMRIRREGRERIKRRAQIRYCE